MSGFQVESELMRASEGLMCVNHKTRHHQNQSLTKLEYPVCVCVGMSNLCLNITITITKYYSLEFRRNILSVSVFEF